MQVREVMTRKVEVVAPNTTLQEAAAKMKSLDVGMLPICDGERLVGMLTDRDVTVRATAEGRDPKTTPVRDVMTEKVLYAFEDDDVAAAADVMERGQVRRLVILNRDKKLVGIVSLGDLAVHTGESDLDDEELAETLTAVSEPAQPKR